jgi:hypothetical protein
MSQPRLSRRQTLSSAAVIAPRTQAATADFSAADVNLRSLQKILASTDERHVVVSWTAGRVYACMMGKPPVPLFGTHAVAAGRARGRTDGSFMLRQRIVGFRTGFDDVKPMTTMPNPVTGAVIELPYTDYGIGDSDYRHDGTFALRPGQAPIRLSAFGPRPWSITGDVASFSDDALAVAPQILQPKVDAVTRFATVDELLDPAVTSANSWISFSAVDPFRPWLKMPEAGFQLWHVYGRKASDPGGLPDYIAAFVAERFPDLFDIPAFA